MRGFQPRVKGLSPLCPILPPTAGEVAANFDKAVLKQMWRGQPQPASKEQHSCGNWCSGSTTACDAVGKGSSPLFPPSEEERSSNGRNYFELVRLLKYERCK